MADSLLRQLAFLFILAYPGIAVLIIFAIVSWIVNDEVEKHGR
jgi:hypothetical protein